MKTDKNILLISDLPNDKLFVASVARTINANFLTALSAKEGAKIISEKSVAATFVDTTNQKKYEEFENAIQEEIGLFSDRVPANSVHFISSDDLDKMDFLVQSPLFGHFIIRNYQDPEVDGNHYGRILNSLLTERAFGLKNILTEKSKVQVIKLARSDQKQSAVEAVRNYLVAAKFSSRMASAIANAVDELLMNAIFDAPVDSDGRPTLASTPRSALLKLEQRHAVEMQIGYDGTFVGITAIDLFGSLDKIKLFTHISKIYTEEEYKVRTSVAGAGIGLATVFRSGGSFLFVSENNKRTEVTVFFKRTESFRDFRDQFRFVSTQFYSLL